MSRIRFLSLSGVVLGATWVARGTFASEYDFPRTRLSRRRRKTPLEFVQIEGSYGSSLILEIGSDANNAVGKLIDGGAEEQASKVSIQSENRDIVGPKVPKKNKAGVDISKKGNNKDENNQEREFPVVQKLNQKMKKQAVAEMDEASALMQMMQGSENSYSMSMDMAPADSPSELNTMDGFDNSSPSDSEETQPSISLPDYQQIFADLPDRENVNSIIATADNNGSSAPVFTASQFLAIAIVLVWIFVVCFN